MFYTSINNKTFHNQQVCKNLFWKKIHGATVDDEGNYVYLLHYCRLPNKAFDESWRWMHLKLKQVLNIIFKKYFFHKVYKLWKHQIFKIKTRSSYNADVSKTNKRPWVQPLTWFTLAIALIKAADSNQCSCF